MSAKLSYEFWKSRSCVPESRSAISAVPDERRAPPRMGVVRSGHRLARLRRWVGS